MFTLGQRSSKTLEKEANVLIFKGFNMRGNHFGKMFSLTTFGESHGAAIGVVINGVPAGLEFSMENLQKELDRRAPGKIPGTTSRREPDCPEVLSGVFEGKTLGTPIAVIVKNQNQRSQDYDNLSIYFF